MLDELKPMHDLQVGAVVLLALTLALAVGVGTAVWAVLKYGSVA